MNFLKINICLMMLWPVWVRGGNIIAPIPGKEMGSYSSYVEFDTSIVNEAGNTQNLKYRIYRYGEIAQSCPLLVQVHEWGGDFARMESIARYERTGLPFVMLAFQFENSGDNTSNWWYGKVNIGQKRTVPYIHNAIVGITRQAAQGDRIQNAVSSTIDSNRIYIFGHSIGGTGAVQIGMRHPELFAAVSSHAGWTRFDDADRANGVTNQFRSAFLSIIGTTQGFDSPSLPHQEDVVIADNADRVHLPPGADYKAYQYTNLNWYFENARTPGTESPFLFMVNGASDDPVHQGDNLQPALEAQRRGYTYNRAEGGHTAGGVFVRLNWLHNFRRNQSFLAFTRRDYGMSENTGVGVFNNLEIHGWDPTTIVDEPTRYSVRLTGAGTADVTLRRLQKLVHEPGTQYEVKINGAPSDTVVADFWGVVTIPQVADDALLELSVIGITNIRNRSTLQTESFAAPPRLLPGGTVQNQRRMYRVNGRLLKISPFNKDVP